MSADNQIVVAAFLPPFDGDGWQYTVGVVQAPHNLTNPEDPDFPESMFAHAKACFLRGNQIWFEGRGALDRAKQLARLIAEEYRVNGWIIENDLVMFIKILGKEKRVELLTYERL